MLNLPRQARDKHRENSKQILRKNAATRFLSAFPMFVPSLSWQNDPFCIKRGQKVTFSHLGIADRSGTYNVHDVCTAAASTLIKSLPEVTQRMR